MASWTQPPHATPARSLASQIDAAQSSLRSRSPSILGIPRMPTSLVPLPMPSHLISSLESLESWPPFHSASISRHPCRPAVVLETSPSFTYPILPSPSSPHTDPGSESLLHRLHSAPPNIGSRPVSRASSSGTIPSLHPAQPVGSLASACPLPAPSPSRIPCLRHQPWIPKHHLEDWLRAASPRLPPWRHQQIAGC